MMIVSARKRVATTLCACALGFVVFSASGCPDEGRAQNRRNTADGGQSLQQSEVEALIIDAVSQADAQGVPAVVAVTDREGEILGLFVMNGRDVNGDNVSEELTLTNVETAVSKAATAAMFASEQNAFTTRTAYYIVQGHFPPGVRDTAGGPLFGVQDSGLRSSDAHSIAYDRSGTARGFGLSGELGGVPLFKNGSPVGGIGIDTVDVFTTQGGAPTLVSPVQNEMDEAIAAYAARRFFTPSAIRSNNAFVDGISLPFLDTVALAPVPPVVNDFFDLADDGFGQLAGQEGAPRTSPLAPEERFEGQYGVRLADPDNDVVLHLRYIGRRVARLGANGFTNVDRVGAEFNGQEYIFDDVRDFNDPNESKDENEELRAEIVSGVPGEVRYPTIASIEPPTPEGGLTAAEVDTIIAQSVDKARRMSAGIRLPRGSQVRLTISVVDVRGNILGIFRMGDGTLFSFDVAVQKARTCAFFSSNDLAVSSRGLGFLAQPFFPPGIGGTEPGPLVRLRDLINRGKLSKEDLPSMQVDLPSTRSPNDGLIALKRDDDPLKPGIQTFDDYPLVVSGSGSGSGSDDGLRPNEGDIDAIREILSDNGGICIFADRDDTNVPFVSPGLQNGMQTFPGAVPLYRGGILVGAIGVSGDGVDEDDLGAAAGSLGFAPPAGTRIDEVDEATLANGILDRLDVLVLAMENHPDQTLRVVYGPLLRSERTKVADRFARGLASVRIPYVKFPRNSDER